MPGGRLYSTDNFEFGSVALWEPEKTRGVLAAPELGRDGRLAAFKKATCDAA
jgi:hypothetical protein